MPELEPYALYFMAAGAVLLLLGLIWLLIVAFRTGFIQKAFTPVLVVLFGAAVALFVPVMNKVFPKPPDTNVKVEQKQNESGEVEEHLTGTGAETAQVKEQLAASKGYVSVQIANKGFTDDDVLPLVGMAQLTFVDLNDNPVTDVTLERLVKLPKLTKLFIARTKVTPEGVKKWVLENPDSKITEVDVTGLNVPGKAIRDWKNADKARKANQ